MDEKTLRGLCVFALAVVAVATGYASTSTPQPPHGWTCHEDGTCTRDLAPTVPVIEYTFSDDEALVIEGCLPPACSEVSLDEAEEEPIAVLTYDAERGLMPHDVVESVRPYVAEPNR